MKKTANKFLKNFGIQVTRYRKVPKMLGYELEEEAVANIAIVRKNTMLSYPRLTCLFNQVAFCEKNSIEGAFVECGVWKGGAIGLMALANLKYGKVKRDLHLFDAFDDICEPDAEKDKGVAFEELEQLGFKHKMAGKLIPIKGIYAGIGGHGTIEECEKLLLEKIKYPKNNIIFHKGWFQNTLPLNASKIGPIAILRLDGDWYASTKVCLENLFDQVVSGGFVIIDDYGHYEGCKKAVDEFIHEKKLNVFLHFVDYTCRYWIKN